MPIRAVKGAVLDRFSDALRFDGRESIEVGDGAGDLENVVVSPGAETLLGHGALEQALAVGAELAVRIWLEDIWALQ